MPFAPTAKGGHISPPQQNPFAWTWAIIIRLSLRLVFEANENSMKRTILLAISILLILSACSSPQTAPTSTQAPTNTPVPPSKTPTRSPNQLPTFVFVVTPTQTPLGDTIDPLLLQLAKKFSIDYPPPYFTCLNPRKAEISPDGKWAILESINPNILDSPWRLDFRFNVVSINGDKEWVTPFYSEIYGIYSETHSEFNSPRYFGSMHVEHWSKDGNYLYFSACPFADGPGLFNELFPERYIYRLDLKTGEVINTQMDVVAAFSPSDRFIVYRGNKTIHIFDFDNGTEKVVNLPKIDYDLFGGFLWSPDEKQIAFTTVKFDNRTQTFYAGDYSVFLLNAEDLSLQLLIEKNRYYTYAWREPNLIFLVDYENYYGTPNAAYNISENQIYILHPVTATP